MKNTTKIDIQNRYEEVLSDYWHKLYRIKELVDTYNGSEFRARSISDRRKELKLIESRKNALEYVFDDCNLVEPEWYKMWIEKLTK